MVQSNLKTFLPREQIVTKRFLLRDFIPADEPTFLTYRTDPKYAEFCAPEEVTPSYSRELLQRFQQWANESPRRNYQFAIVDRRIATLIGCGGLRCDAHGKTAELGIELAPQVWGRYAYAIEIGKALIDFGFSNLGLEQIRGISIHANQRVTRLAQRYGFTAMDRPTRPDWMNDRGWHQVEWQLQRTTWEESLK